MTREAGGGDADAVGGHPRPPLHLAGDEPPGRLRGEREGGEEPTFGLQLWDDPDDDFLIQDPLDYFQFERRRYVNAGQPIPTSLTALYGDPGMRVSQDVDLLVPGAELWRATHALEGIGEALHLTGSATRRHRTEPINSGAMTCGVPARAAAAVVPAPP